MVELEERHLSSKPTWDKIPSNIKYIAQDKSGDWYGYENEPEVSGREWRDVTAGHSQRLSAEEDDWQDTLEERTQ
jgi:hypothetical protein